MQQAPFTLNELPHPALWLLWVLGASKPIVSPAEEATGLALDNGHRGAAPPFTAQGFMFTPAPSDALAAFRILKAPLQEAVSTLAPPPLVPRDSSLGCQWPVCITTYYLLQTPKVVIVNKGGYIPGRACPYVPSTLSVKVTGLSPAAVPLGSPERLTGHVP